MRSTVVTKKKPALAKLYLMPPILKLLTALFVVVFLCTTSFYIMHQQAVTQLGSVDSQKKRVEAEVTKQAKSLGQLKSQTKDISENEKNYQTIVRSFPLESSVAELLSSITKLGTENGLRFVHFRPRAPNPAGYYVDVPIDVLVTGKFDQIARFLGALANLPNSVVIVDSFELSHPETAEPGILNLKFMATSYYVLPTSLEIKT